MSFFCRAFLLFCFLFSFLFSQVVEDSLQLENKTSLDSLSLKESLEIVGTTELDSIEIDSLAIPYSAIYIKKSVKYKDKKENPAYTILKKVWENKKEIGLNGLDCYEYELYEKTEIDISHVDSAFIKWPIFSESQFIFDEVVFSEEFNAKILPIYLNESLYNYYGKNHPKKVRKDLIGSKTDGLGNNNMVTIVSEIVSSEINYYDDRIYLFDNSFISPLSKDGFSYYDYRLLDSIKIEGITKYRIQFNPKNNQNFAFSGKMTIEGKNYALIEISMQTHKELNVNFVKKAFIEEFFQQVNDSIYLPEKKSLVLDLPATNKNAEAMGILVKHNKFYSQYNLSNKKEDSFYNANYNPYKNGAYEKPEDFWFINRPEPLMDSEQSVIRTFSKLKGSKKLILLKKFARLAKTGYWNVNNSLDLGNFYNIFGYNDVEGYRIRIGARTYFSDNDPFRVGVYTAYGFDDEKFKYGLEYKQLINYKNRLSFGLATHRDVDQIGTSLTKDFGVMNRSFASSYIANRDISNVLSNIEKYNAFVSVDPIKNISFRVDFHSENIKSASQNFKIDFDRGNGVETQVNNGNLSFSLIAKPTAQYNTFGIERIETTSKKSPTILFRYIKGIDGFLGGDFDYEKLEFLYNQSIYFGDFGRTDLVLESGKIFGTVPISLLSSLPGNEFFLNAGNSFNMLRFYEFVTDAYSSLHTTHHFNGKILNSIPLIKKLKYRSLIFAKMAWGNISDDNIAINQSSIQYIAPEKDIYYEYGLGIENIGLGNLRPLRIDFNWRGNYLENPNAEKFRLTLGFGFSF